MAAYDPQPGKYLEPDADEEARETMQSLAHALASPRCPMTAAEVVRYKKWYGSVHKKKTWDGWSDRALEFVDLLEGIAGRIDETLSKSEDVAQSPPMPTVDIGAMTVGYGGETYPVSSKQALRWVKVLADHPGEWISGRDLLDYDEELDGARTNLLRNHLPEEVASLIESETGKGSRLIV